MLIKFYTRIIFEKPNIRSLWDSVFLPVVKGVLSAPELIGSKLSMGLRIFGTLQGMGQMATLTGSIRDTLVHRLSLIDKEELQFAQLLHNHCAKNHCPNNHCAIEKVDADAIAKILEEEKIILCEAKPIEKSFVSAVSKDLVSGTQDYCKDLNFYCQYLNPDPKTLDRIKSPSFNWGAYSDHKSKDEIIKFLTQFQDSKNKKPSHMDLSQVKKSVADAMTDYLIRITESHLISPWSSYGVGQFTALVSSSIQNMIIQKQLSSEIELLQKELDDLEKKGQKTADTKNEIKKLENQIKERKEQQRSNQTYSGLIMHEAKKYTQAYSQLELIHFSQKQDTTQGIATEGQREHAEGIKSNAPAGISEMTVAATKNGLNIKIVDKDYIPTEEDKANGINIVVYTPGEKDKAGKDTVGHFVLLSQDLDSEGRPIEIDLKYLNPEDGDCGFAIMAHLSKKSIQKLRDETAKHILNNPNNFSKVLETQNWVIERYPHEANSVLGVGAGLKNQLEKCFKASNLEEMRKWEMDTIDELEKKGVLAALPDTLDENEKENLIKEKKSLEEEQIKLILNSRGDLYGIQQMEIGEKIQKIDEKLNKNPVDRWKASIQNTSSKEDVTKIHIMLYILNHLPPEKATEMLKGGFVQTDKNLYADLVKISRGVRGGDWSEYGHITSKIKKCNDEIEAFELKKHNVKTGVYTSRVVASDDSDRDPNELWKELQDKAEQEFKKPEEIFNKEERPKLEEEIRSREKEREKFGPPISIQGGDIFPEIRVEMINGKTVINLEANPYSHDKIIKSVEVECNIGIASFSAQYDGNSVTPAVNFPLSNPKVENHNKDCLKNSTNISISGKDVTITEQVQLNKVLSVNYSSDEQGIKNVGGELCGNGINANIREGTLEGKLQITPCISVKAEVNPKAAYWWLNRLPNKIAETWHFLWTKEQITTGICGQSKHTYNKPMEDNFDTMSDDEREKNSERPSNKKAA